MARAHLGHGIELDYQDSGIPQIGGSGRTYDTLVCVHGPVFNKEIFSPLFSALPPGLRLLTYNHRGFRGSSSIKPDPASERNSTRKTYIEDLIFFLEWINRTLDLPKPPFILSWCKAGNLLLALASPTFLESSMRKRGLANVAGLILLDCPGAILGRAPTIDLVDSVVGYPPFNGGKDPMYPHVPFYLHAAEEKLKTPPERFVSWICGFYKHTLPSERDFVKQPSVYSPWAYQCSSEQHSRVVQSAYQPETYHDLAQYFKVRSGIEEQRQLAMEALVKQSDVPVVMMWNGESPECMVDAAKGGIEMGARVVRCSENGNALFFVHETREFWKVVMRVMAGMERGM